MTRSTAPQCSQDRHDNFKTRSEGAVAKVFPSSAFLSWVSLGNQIRSHKGNDVSSNLFLFSKLLHVLCPRVRRGM